MRLGEKIWLSSLALLLVCVAVWAWLENQRTMMREAFHNVKYGETEPAREWIEAGGDSRMADRASQFLERALRTRDKDFVLYLLEAGADPNPGTQYAAERNSLEVIQACLDKGGDLDPNPDLKGMHILRTRLQSSPEDKRVARFLLELGADPNGTTVRFDHPIWSSEPILHAAVKRSDAEMVRILCEYEADVNAPSEDSGHTPLHVVIHDGPHVVIHDGLPVVIHDGKAVAEAIEKIEILVEFGADLNIKNELDVTPLEFAWDEYEDTGDPGVEKVVNYLESLQAAKGN